MKRTAIYARISTKDKGQDLDTQLLPLKAYVEHRGWQLTDVYTDELSGAKESRPALNRLMKDATKRKFDVVLVFRFDRFARSSKQLINALEAFNSLGVDFASYEEAIDTSTPTGKVMFTIIGAFAEFERAIISERVKAGLEKAKAKGKKLGRPKVEVDVEEVKRLRGQGLSIRQIALTMGFKKSLIASCLHNF